MNGNLQEKLFDPFAYAEYDLWPSSDKFWQWPVSAGVLLGGPSRAGLAYERH